MVLQKCKRGHYYDSDKFAECPYCALEKNVVEDQTEEWSQNAYEATETVVGKHPASNGGKGRLT